MSTVLLMGETGTGKSVLAQLIHKHSNRRDAQFISVHCGALPNTLIESEMFGHEKGAFTGAVHRKLGKFEFASGGTIFLDEIGTTSFAAQIKLLQVLQDGTYQRPGNIRELENLVERTYILETSSVFTPESFPSELFEKETVSFIIPSSEQLTLAEVR